MSSSCGQYQYSGIQPCLPLALPKLRFQSQIGCILIFPPRSFWKKVLKRKPSMFLLTSTIR